MYNIHPETFTSQIAAARRSELELAAEHARVVRILKCAKKQHRKAAQPPPAPRVPPRPQCPADIG